MAVKPVDQKLPDELKSLGGSCQASYATQVSVDHPLPYVEPSIYYSRNSPLD